MNTCFPLLFVTLLAAPFVACSSSDPAATAEAGAPETGAPEGGAVEDAPSGGQCTSARETLLKPVDKVSTGAVSIVSDVGGVKTLYVDASAGGLAGADARPYVYVDLGAGTRVALTDKTATRSTDWDLAIKRVTLFSNSGDAGSGSGGAVPIKKAFAAVTDAEVLAAAPAAESFFDADCVAKVDQVQSVQTSFTGWYLYDQSTMIPTPDPSFTVVVRGGTGRLYKVGIKAYDGLPDGGSRGNVSTGEYLLQVKEVTGP